MTAVAADLHEALDAEGYLPAKVTFNDMIVLHLVPERLNLVIRKVLDPGIGIDPRDAKNLPGCGKANAKNISQTDLHAFLAGKFHSCDTSHSLLPPRSLTLFVSRVLAADDPNDTVPSDDAAVLADGLHRRLHFHSDLNSSQISKPDPYLAAVKIKGAPLLVSINNPGPGQVVGRHVEKNPVAGENPDKMHPHFPRDVGQDPVTIVQFNAKHGIGKRLNYFTANLDHVIFGHAYPSTSLAGELFPV